ncbi:Protein FAM49A [Fukomys damarensis]|uniref:Protein FAM49A n=1 Tax=Fukomys damarensis TaxID=885580 RepID=A0A091CZA3_FUKDA|nr:Protein FAM49A [Fukomys damarensis]
MRTNTCHVKIQDPNDEYTTEMLLNKLAVGESFKRNTYIVNQSQESHANAENPKQCHYALCLQKQNPVNRKHHGWPQNDQCLQSHAGNSRVQEQVTSEETLMFCMKVIVGGSSSSMTNHMHPMGAFFKTCRINMKGYIKVLKEQAPDSMEGLLNALRFTTKHLNDESTSKQIPAMLQQEPSLRRGSVC